MPGQVCALPYRAPSDWLSCANPLGHSGPHGMWGTADGGPVLFCVTCRQVLECICGHEAWTTVK